MIVLARAKSLKLMSLKNFLPLSRILSIPSIWGLAKFEPPSELKHSAFKLWNRNEVESVEANQISW